jgi:hypothetical protein
VSDWLDRRIAPVRALALAALLPCLVACQPLNPTSPPPVGDGGTPCSRSVAVDSDTVVIAAQVCDPWCIHVPTGTSVYFINNDTAMYLFVADPPLSYDVQVPGRSPAVTLPLDTPGTVSFTAVHAPTATVTVFVE